MKQSNEVLPLLPTVSLAYCIRTTSVYWFGLPALCVTAVDFNVSEKLA